MEETIKENLRTLEAKENIKILYACKSGSRAWGFPSKDSDYDVRFISYGAKIRTSRMILLSDDIADDLFVQCPVSYNPSNSS